MPAKIATPVTQQQTHEDSHLVYHTRAEIDALYTTTHRQLTIASGQIVKFGWVIFFSLQSPNDSQVYKHATTDKCSHCTKVVL